MWDKDASKPMLSVPQMLVRKPLYAGQPGKVSGACPHPHPALQAAHPGPGRGQTWSEKAAHGHMATWPRSTLGAQQGNTGVRAQWGASASAYPVRQSRRGPRAGNNE